MGWRDRRIARADVGAPATAHPARAVPATIAPTGGSGRELGNVRVGKVIEDYLARRQGLGDLSPWELPIVVACRDVIANTLAQLPLVAYRSGQPRPDQPAVLIRPDPFEPRWLTLHRLANDLTGRGYAFLRPTARYASGEPSAVQVLEPARVSAWFDPAGGRITELWFDGQGYRPGLDGIVWIPYRVTAPGTLGTAPIADCWRAVTYLTALWQMAGSFWEAGFPSTALVVDGALNPAQRLELKQSLIGAWARRHEPAVIDRGGRLEAVGANAVDSQLVESIETANAECARAFGVMPSLVNVRAGDSLTYSTTETEFDKWLKVGLGAYLNRLEAAFTDLLPYGTDARFDTSELLRTDAASRVAYYTAGLTAGWLTPDEVRGREGLPPLAATPPSTPNAGAALIADPPTPVPN